MIQEQQFDKWDGLTDEQEAEMWAESAAHHRALFWRFVRLLLWGRYSKGKGERNALEADHSFLEKIYWRTSCLLAMLLGRSYSDNDKSYEYYVLGWINYQRDGYGWGCDMIEFNPKTLRYNIERDGECTY